VSNVGVNGVELHFNMNLIPKNPCGCYRI